MLDGLNLLSVARHLLEECDGNSNDDAFLRRSVSTAYYAVFHTVTSSAALSLTGSSGDAATAAIVRRGFDHRRIREVCEDLSKNTLPARYQTALKRQSMDQTVRRFAGDFPLLQELRHAADYDPSLTFEQSEVRDIVDAARRAIELLDRLRVEDKRELLTLLLLGIRK